MDTITDPDITFNENGISNYYDEYKTAERNLVKTGEEGQKYFDEAIARIKQAGKGQQYDCIMGVSGGVDSSYVAYLAKQAGLKPLAVHFDNGWNSELAVMNIENIVGRLNLDLHTHVVDWEEFKDLQLAYLKASVIDIEVVTDHAISATLYRLAKKYKIKYMLSGSNIVTEYLMPRSWIFNKDDHINIRAIHKQYGTVPLKTYPLLSSWLKKYSSKVLKVETVSLLNYMPYNKEEVKETIIREFGWRDYGGKHYESIFTKFYQAYILPEKFKVDKRKPHLSTLVFSGQLTKEEAVKELAKPLYNQEEFKKDYEFVLKKFGISHNEFQELMNRPVRPHTDFEIETSLYKRYPALKILRPLVRSFNGV